jgi:tetratricopeptide (TPR) repeat protein
VTTTVDHGEVASAFDALSRGDYDEAAQLAQQAIGKDGNDGEAWAILGLARSAQGDADAAIDALEHADRLGYESIAMLEGLGRLYLDRRDGTLDVAVLLESIQLARNVFMRLEQIDTSNELARAQLAILNATPDDGTDVSRIGDQALDHFQRAEEYFAQQDFDNAIQEYEAAIQIAPDFALAMLYLGDTFFQQADFTSAALWFEQVTQVNPDLLQGWEFLGDAYRELGLAQHAHAAYTRVLTLDSSNEAARQGFDRIRAVLGTWEHSYFETYGFRLTYPADMIFNPKDVFGEWNREHGAVIFYPKDETYLLSVTWQSSGQNESPTVPMLTEWLTTFASALPDTELLGTPLEFRYGIVPMVYQLYQYATSNDAPRHSGAVTVWICDSTLFNLQLEMRTEQPDRVPATLFLFIESFRCDA